MSEATTIILEVSFQQAKHTGNEEASCHGYAFIHEKPKQGAGCPNDTPTSQGYLGEKKNDSQDITLFGYIDAYLGILNDADRKDQPPGWVGPDAILLSKMLPEILEAHPNVTDIYLLEEGKRINSVWRKALDAENLDKVETHLADVITYLRNKNISLVPVQAPPSKKGLKNSELASSMVRDTDKFLRKFSEAKGYWNNKTEVNRLLASSRWYFATDGRTAEKVGDHVVYHMGAPSKEDELVGKPESDSHYSVVFLKEADPSMEFIRIHQLDAAEKAGQVGVAIARLDNIISSGNYALMDEYGEQSIRATRDGAVMLGNTTLSRVLNPPMLSWRAATATQDLENILSDYVNGKLGDQFHETDITDLLYVQEETKKKTITKLDPSIGTGCKSLSVDMKYSTGTHGGIYTTKILLGVDLPRRNTLSALADKEPKVKILTWAVSDVSFRFLTILEVDGEYGIWSGYYSNLRLVIKK